MEITVCNSYRDKYSRQYGMSVFYIQANRNSYHNKMHFSSLSHIFLKKQTLTFVKQASSFSLNCKFPNLSHCMYAVLNTYHIFSGKMPNL